LLFGDTVPLFSSSTTPNACAPGGRGTLCERIRVLETDQTAMSGLRVEEAAAALYELVRSCVFHRDSTANRCRTVSTARTLRS
jgi:hypothetical protein